MHNAFIALGANLGDPVTTIQAAFSALSRLPNTRLIAVSSLYRTAPVGLLNQPDFINAVARIKTARSPRELLADILALEADFGRQRSIKNAPRTLDLDLLLHGENCIHETNLTLPHPRMHQRAFVLIPLHEVAPELSIPGLGKIADLLIGCQDQVVERLQLTT